MKKIEISDIDYDLEYEGYLWYSNEQAPIYINKERKVESTDFKAFPFIIEGNLIDKNGDISISIKNVDGKYLVYRVDFQKINQDQLENVEFIAQKNNWGIEKIKIAVYWKETAIEPDNENLKDIVSLEPKWTAFRGFIK
jgi:CRISPR type III-associated protein (TIGR04423 family)